MWRRSYSSFAGGFSGERALAQAAEQNRIERFFTFPNFERSAERRGEELRAADLVEVGAVVYVIDQIVRGRFLRPV